MKSSLSFSGVAQIVRFNWPFYLSGALALLIGAAGYFLFREPLLLAAVFIASWWVMGSLLVSWWVYDLSDWPVGGWFRRLGAGGSVLNVHSGFDETTLRLRAWLPTSKVVALDLFDPSSMTEPSIRRAREFLPPLPGTFSGSFGSWPLEEGAFDTICFLLAAHEFRSPSQRVALLAEAARVSGMKGVIVLAEHTRDLPNFLAFGPGFFHFHSVATWRRDWTEAGLTSLRETRVTPFLRVWTLKPIR